MNKSNKATMMDELQSVITALESETFDNQPYVMADGLEIVLRDYEEPGMYHVGVQEEDFWNSGVKIGACITVCGHVIKETPEGWTCTTDLELSDELIDALDEYVGRDTYDPAAFTFDDWFEMTYTSVEAVLADLPDTTYYELNDELYYYIAPEDTEDYADEPLEDLDEEFLLDADAKEISRERAAELFLAGSYEVIEPM